MQMIKISVVTVCYNVEDVLEETMISVLNQSYKNIEYIIVDGNSNDNTVPIIKKYANDYPIKYVSEKDSGIYNAMNKGVRMSTGNYVIFINAGDRFYNYNVIKKVVKQINITKANAYYANVKYEYVNRSLLRKNEDYNIKKLLEGVMPCHQSIFAKRKLLLESPFDESFKICADFDWFAKIYKKNKFSSKKIKYLDILVSTVEMGGISTRLDSSRLLDDETKRSLRKTYPIIFFIRYIIMGRGTVFL